MHRTGLSSHIINQKVHHKQDAFWGDLLLLPCHEIRDWAFYGKIKYELLLGKKKTRNGDEK